MFIVKNLVQGSALTTSAAVYYTAPTGVSTQITQLSFTNTDTVARTISIYLVDDSNAPAAPDTIVKSKTLQPNETFTPFQALAAVIAPLGTLQAVADANSVVVIKCSGVEFTV